MPADPPSAAPTSSEKSRDFQRYTGKVSRQASVFFSGTLFNVVCSYLFKIFVSRLLGAAAMGYYALGHSLVQILTTLASVGLPKTLARFVAVYQGTGRSGQIHGLFHRALAVVGLGTTALGILLYLGRDFLAQRVFHEPEFARYLPLFALLLPMGALSSLLGEYLRGHQEVAQRTLISQFILLPLWIVVSLALFQLGWRLSAYVSAEVFAHLVALLLMYRIGRRKTPDADPDLPQLPALGPEERSFAKTMMGLDLISFVGHRLDILLLGVLLASDQVGIYSIAVAASSFVSTLLRSVNSIFGPIISDLHTRGERDLLERLFQTTTKWIFAFTFPLVAVILAFAPALMGLFGDAFRAGGPALALLAVGHLINVGTGSVGNLLVMSGNPRMEFHASVFTAGLTLGLHLLFIPRWGILGAAGALAMGLMAANVLRMVLVRKHLGLWAYNRGWWRLPLALIPSSLTVWGVAWLAPIWELHELLAFALAGATSYGVLTLFALLLCLDDDDRLVAEAVREKVRQRLGKRS